MSQSIVHLLRHGEVENPGHILYGRLPGYHLSERGRVMAVRLGEYFSDIPVTHLRCSPLERTRETIAPIAAAHPGVEVVYDERVIESGNLFEGEVFGPGYPALRRPRAWWLLRNPLRPSWGEPYTQIAARMREAIADAAAAAGDDGQAVIVTHQLPIWMARLDAEGRCLVHDPRRRQCTQASVTSFTVVDARVVRIDHREPAGDLLQDKHRGRGFRPGS